jgi:hypothetical protein
VSKAARQPGQMSGGRIAAIVILSVVAVLLLLVALRNFLADCHRTGFDLPWVPKCDVIYTYGVWSLVLAGVAAFGAILTYWSRPR